MYEWERTFCSECSSLWVPLGEESGLCSSGDKGDKEADCSASSAELHIIVKAGECSQKHM